MLGPSMTIAELAEGLAKLNEPNQGMSYHSGGPRRGAPKYDAYTGERIYPPHDPAELNVYGERAKFLHRLIENGPSLARLLEDAKTLAAELPPAEGLAAARSEQVDLSAIRPGDEVLIRARVDDRDTPLFSPIQHVALNVGGSLFTAKASLIAAHLPTPPKAEGDHG